MDNNAHASPCEDVLKAMKNRIEILNNKCSTEKEKLGQKVSEISCLDKNIEQLNRELCEYKSKTEVIQESWEEREIEMEKLKWMQEKATVILECNRRKNELQSKTMNIIRRNHSNLTLCAFKNVRQETARKIINNQINNLNDRKKELENKLHKLQKIKTEIEYNLTKASAELMEVKARGETVIRLRKKLQESETSRLNAIMKLNNLRKTSRFMDMGDSKSTIACHKFE